MSSPWGNGDGVDEAEGEREHEHDDGEADAEKETAGTARLPAGVDAAPEPLGTSRPGASEACGG